MVLLLEILHEIKFEKLFEPKSLITFSANNNMFYKILLQFDLANRVQTTAKEKQTCPANRRCPFDSQNQ